MLVISPAEPAFHQLVKQADVLRQRSGQFFARAVSIRRHKASGKPAVVKGIFDPVAQHPGKMGIFDALPQTEKFRHTLNEGGRLRPEQD